MAIWGQIQHQLGLLLLVAFALVVAYVLRRFGLLPFSPTESAAVERANRAENELAIALQRIGELEATRSMRPIVEALQTNAAMQAEVSKRLSDVVDRLAHHNGSFKHVEKSLGLIENSLQTLTGFIVGLHGLELQPPAHERRAS